MRLLKAFIRIGCVDTVVRALQKAGTPGITISHMHGVGYDYDPQECAPDLNEARRKRSARRWGP